MVRCKQNQLDTTPEKNMTLMKTIGTESEEISLQLLIQTKQLAKDDVSSDLSAKHYIVAHNKSYFLSAVN